MWPKSVSTIKLTMLVLGIVQCLCLSCRDTIQRKVDKISSCKVFDVFKKPVDGKQKNFRDFHHDIMENQKKHIDFLVSEYEEMGPLLMKVEEILVSSRSKSHPRLASYYSFWESQVYKAVINFIKINLDDLLDIMHSRVPLFKESSNLNESNNNNDNIIMLMTSSGGGGSGWYQCCHLALRANDPKGRRHHYQVAHIKILSSCDSSSSMENDEVIKDVYGCGYTPPNDNYCVESLRFIVPGAFIIKGY